MAVSNDFIEYIIDQLSNWREVSSRKMFGGAGLYCDGVVFAFVADDVIYLKVDDTNRKQFEEAGSTAFQPFDDQRTVLSYFELPADVLEDPNEFAEWAEVSLRIQKK
jgi:DNA transformation protein